MEEPEPLPQILTPCSSGRKSCGDPNSPEFEFWMVRNPSFPQPNLLSADKLFCDGVVLPLYQLRLSNETLPHLPTQHESSGPEQIPEPETYATESAELSAASQLTSSKRWSDIFRKNDKKSSQASMNADADDCSTKEIDIGVKEKRRDKKNSGAGHWASATELNINIWPFSRSRSAGNGGTRPRSAAATRKVSSAPCSRSNSRGESKSRKWPSSPAKARVHVGRSSPVWQVHRRSSGCRRSSVAAGKSVEKDFKRDENDSRPKVPVAGGAKARVWNLNVPVCVGYRQHLSCRSDENSVCGVAAGAAGGVSGEGVRVGNIFNIKSLFSRKVY